MSNVPTVNITPWTRFWLYLVAAFGAPAVTYLNAVGIFGIPEVALFTAYLAVVSGLAAANTDLSEPQPPATHKRVPPTPPPAEPPAH